MKNSIIHVGSDFANVKVWSGGGGEMCSGYTKVVLPAFDLKSFPAWNIFNIRKSAAVVLQE